MTIREKFNRVTALIESQAEFENKSPSEIASCVAKDIGISVRDLSVIFNFLTGQTLYEYIKERKMTVAAASILESETFNVQKAVEISGLGEQSAFNKSFKRMYDITPTEMFLKNNRSCLKSMATWDEIGEIEQSFSNVGECECAHNAKERTFGIEYSKFAELKELIELQEYYSFDRVQAELAYYIFKTYNIEPQKAFLFVNEIKYNDDIAFECDDPENCRLTREEYFDEVSKKFADDPEIRYVFFDVELCSLSIVFYVIDKLHAIGENDVTKLHPKLIEMCSCKNLEAGFCKRATEYYLERATEEYGEEAFGEYIDNLLAGYYFPEAFESILSLDDFDDCGNCYIDFNEELEQAIIADTYEEWLPNENDYSYDDM